MTIDPKAESEFRIALGDVARDAMQELRDTLAPGYKPNDLGYTDVEHARLTIIKMADKRINQMSAAHLKRCGS